MTITILAMIMLCSGHTITDQSKAQDGTIVFEMPDGARLRCKDFAQDPTYGNSTITMEDHNKYRCQDEPDTSTPDVTLPAPQSHDDDPDRQKI